MDNFPHPFQSSSFQSTGRTEYGMYTFADVRHHELCISVPFSSRLESVCHIPFRFWSWSEKWPMTWREHLCTFSHRSRIVKTYLFVWRTSPYDVVVHRREDDPSLELFCLQPQGFHNLGFRGESATLWILGKSSTRIPSALHRFHPILCIASTLNKSNLVSYPLFDSGNWRTFPRHNTESGKIINFLLLRDWSPLHRSPGPVFHLQRFPNLFLTLLRFPIFTLESIFESHRTISLQLASQLYIWWFAGSLSNLVQEKQLRSLMKTWIFTK